MRSKFNMRKSRPVHVATGALILTIPSFAVALTAGQADAQGAAGAVPTTAAPPSSPSALKVDLERRHLAYGDDVIVTGTTSRSAAGQKLLLEFARAGSTGWRSLSATRVGRFGHFRLIAALQQSGLVRVVGAGGASTARATPRSWTGANGAAIAPSASQHVAVAAELRMPTQSLDVLGGQSVDVRGKLLPALGGRQVRLQSRSAGNWQTLASARTGPRGGFDLHYSTGSTGQQPLRVRFAGDRLNTRTSSRAGWLTVYRQSLASWYNDGGSTACGFHAYFGVANKSVPCGTQVTLHYGGHTVTATVDDRGPFVGGREWDLNQNTAGALGFGGVDTVWSSI